MSGPSLSIIMPAHNSAETIETSIESIQSQDYESWELIVINDHSEDDTKGVVKDIAKKDKRIKHICQLKL